MDRARMEGEMTALEELRRELDKIDGEIVKLFEERMLLCEKVGEFKATLGHKVFDSQREREKLRDVSAMISGEFNKKCVEELYQQIMSMGRELQYQILAGKGALCE